MKKIILKNNSVTKEFFYSVKENARSRKIKMQMKSSDTVEITLPKKTMLNALSLKLFSAENFMQKNTQWIFKASKKFEEQENKIPLSDDNWREKKVEFLGIAKERVEYFNEFYGFEYKNIFIKDTKSRWGSCSAAGNLNFNYRIFMLTQQQRDYIIIHELCHLQEMNHSEDFWNLVKKKSPEYKRIRGDLKQYHFDIN